MSKQRYRKSVILLAMVAILIATGFMYSTVMAQDVGADVTVTITGNGRVTSGGGWIDPIDCPGDCVGNSRGGGNAQLFSTPDSGWSAQGWGGLCAGQSRDFCTRNFFGGGGVAMTFVLPDPEIALYGGPGSAAAFIPIGGAPSPFNGTDFGVAKVLDGTIDHRFTIFNFGTGALTLTGAPAISLSGPNAGDFTVITQPAASIPSDGSTRFAIRFDPSAAGTRSATVTIANDDTDEGNYSFPISGRGFDAPANSLPPVNYSETVSGDLKDDTVFVPCSVGADYDEFVLGIGANRWVGTYGETGDDGTQSDFFRVILPTGALIDRITFERGGEPGEIVKLIISDASSKQILETRNTTALIVPDPPSTLPVLNFILIVDFNTTPKNWAITIDVVGNVQSNSGPILTFESNSPAIATVNEGELGTACGRFFDRERDAVTIAPGPLTANPLLPETGPTQTFGDAPTNSFGRWEWSVTSVDGPSDSQDLVLTAADNSPLGANTSQRNFQLEVVNVAPMVNTPTVSPDPANELTTATAQATWTDPGVLDVATCTVDYGDGSGPVAGTANFNNGNGTCTGPAHTYADSGNYLIEIAVTDKDGGVGGSSYTYLVNNLPPVISSVINNGPIVDGSDAVITVSATDPAGAVDPLVYAFDCDNDGNYEIGPQTSNSASCAFTQNGNYPVNVQVSDDDGGVTTGATTVSFGRNNPPVANNQDISTEEGVTLDITLTATDDDGDSLSFGVVDGPSNGSLSGTPPTLTYTPDPGFIGADSFTFKANDGIDDSNIATVTIAVEKSLLPSTGFQLYLSPSRTVRLDGLRIEDEDIAWYDFFADSWAMLFDGSDVGLKKSDVDAIHLEGNDTILLSFDRPINFPTLGWIDDSDIVKFIPTQLGEETVGTWELYFDGSDVGLTTNGEDIDGIGFSTEGELLITTMGTANVAGLRAADEDILLFRGTSWGEETVGTWELYFDGSDVRLSAGSEDLNGISVDNKDGTIYLTTKGKFQVTSENLLNGDADDIIGCADPTLGATTTCVFAQLFDGDTKQWRKDIDGITVASLRMAPYTTAAHNRENDGEVAPFEVAADDFVIDEDDPELDQFDMEEEQMQLFLPLITR